MDALLCAGPAAAGLHRPLTPRGQCPRGGPRPAHLRLCGFPRKKRNPLPAPPAAPRSPRGAAEAVRTLRGGRAAAAPPRPRRGCGGGAPGGRRGPLPAPASRRRATSRRSGVAPAPRFASGRGVSRGAPNNKGKFESSRRRTGCGDVREQCRCQPARPPPLKGAPGAAGGPAAGLGDRDRGGGGCAGPAPAPGSLWHCPPARGAEPMLRVTAPSLPRPPPPRSLPSAARKTRRPLGGERSGRAPRPRGCAGQGGPAARPKGPLPCPHGEPCYPSKECFAKGSGPKRPRGPGPERFQRVRPLLQR
ncbi:translation initiation factor IF-2-like [Chiroxiphia lanceolata]|uniref:translation initiation factor IF-2-like n=1 Tax=Chiroxiphia lanceolata TaxID=296741 RepID=UPI0013CE840D|nr:translation initiation factor IF-2-like [Chiroxiphia lanceolata]